MPNINGIEFCYKNSWRGMLSNYFVSALSHDDEIIQALTVGGDDLLLNRLVLKQFIAKVNSHFEERRKSKVKDWKR